MAAIIEEAQKSVQLAANYNAQVAIEEAQRGIEFAIATNNANAYAKFVELKMKMSGLLVEKIDVRGQLAPMLIQIEGLKTPEPDFVEVESE